MVFLKFISVAKEEGSTVHCGGQRPEHLKKRGHFIEPTILGNANPSMQAAKMARVSPTTAT